MEALFASAGGHTLKPVSVSVLVGQVAQCCFPTPAAAFSSPSRTKSLRAPFTSLTLVILETSYNREFQRKAFLAVS